MSVSNGKARRQHPRQHPANRGPVQPPAHQPPPYDRPYVPGPKNLPALPPPATNHPGKLEPSRPHVPRRPGWHCRQCPGFEWPCPTARILLTMEYERDLIGLAQYMAQYMVEARIDLDRLYPSNLIPHDVMHERFLGWIKRKGPLGPDHPDLKNPPNEGPHS